MSKESHAEAAPTVEDYTNKRMITINSKNSVTDAVKIMAGQNISSVAVTDTNSKIVGILTERDVMKIIATEVSPDAITVGSLMSFPLVAIKKNSSLEDAAKLMIQKGLRHLLVESQETEDIIGIITTTDLARYLKQRLPPQELESLLLDAMYPPAEEYDRERLFW